MNRLKDTIIKYKYPISASSTKPCDLFNEDGIKIGTVQRYYSNNFIKLIDTIGNIQISVFVAVKDNNDKTIAHSENNILKSLYSKMNWKIALNGESNYYELRDKTKIKTSRLMKFIYNGQQYTLSKEIGNSVNIVDDNGNLIAEMSYKLAVPKTNIIKIHNDNFNNYLLVCLLHTFDLCD